MIVDENGFVGFTQKEVVEHLKKKPDFSFDGWFLVDGRQYQKAQSDSYISIADVQLWENRPTDFDQELFHSALQEEWLMPDKYKSLDIQKHLLSLCDTDQKVSRVNTELGLYEKFNLLNLLRYLKYLRDVADENKTVWGVGRGSSCCSYCLYLLRIHRVDSIKYNLDINEFLR